MFFLPSVCVRLTPYEGRILTRSLHCFSRGELVSRMDKDSGWLLCTLSREITVALH